VNIELKSYETADKVVDLIEHFMRTNTGTTTNS
jgi:hypothetical protein